MGCFSDPMVDCLVTQRRYRADQLMYSAVTSIFPLKDEEDEPHDEVVLGYVCVHQGTDAQMAAAAKPQVKGLLRSLLLVGSSKPLLKELEFADYTSASSIEVRNIPSPAYCGPGWKEQQGVIGGAGSLTEVREFNLMFETCVGALAGGAGGVGGAGGADVLLPPSLQATHNGKAYLRPETAQGIFLNFKNVLTSSRLKIPFGIAQIGKAFRNEITPRNFIFRSREFEQMEIEWFIAPCEREGDNISGSGWGKEHDEWLSKGMDFIVNKCGVRPSLLDLDVHPPSSLAHYALACTDITYNFPFGKQELMGVAARGDYDLRCHQEASGKSMEYFDEKRKEKYIPHCIEPSVGVDRLFLAILCSAYEADKVNGEPRLVLKLNPQMAPVKASILPLVKNKPHLVAKAKDLYTKLRVRWNVEYDDTGAIGRRYRRADEIGTPFCITVDFDTLEKDDCVTVRYRDSTEQVRMPIQEVEQFLQREVDGF